MGPLPRRLASVGLLGLLLAAGWGYVHLPDRGATGAAPPTAPSPLQPAYHAYDRPVLTYPEKPGPCESCHGFAPHRRDPARRAFLNLHSVALDCGVCHLSGVGLAVRRFRAGEAVTAATLAAGEGGRLFAARRRDPGWTVQTLPGPGAALVPAGPACGECHRRGSPLLAGEGLYDAYRRRVLEELAVLPLVEPRP